MDKITWQPTVEGIATADKNICPCCKAKNNSGKFPDSQALCFECSCVWFPDKIKPDPLAEAMAKEIEEIVFLYGDMPNQVAWPMVILTLAKRAKAYRELNGLAGNSEDAI